MSKQSIIEILITVAVAPFFLWAALAMIARKDMQMLARIYPWLRALNWGTWVLGCFLGLMGLFGVI